MRFSVEIMEILAKTIEVESESEYEAIEIAQKQYYDELVILDSADFQEVMFNTRGVIHGY